MPKKKRGESVFPEAMPEEMQEAIQEMVEGGHGAVDIRDKLREEYEVDEKCAPHIPPLPDLYNLCVRIRQKMGYEPPERPKRPVFPEGQTPEEKYLLQQQMALVEDVPLKPRPWRIYTRKPKVRKAGRQTLRSGALLNPHR